MVVQLNDGVVQSNNDDALQVYLTTPHGSVQAAYAEHYGSERWPVLVKALARPSRYCALLNKYADWSVEQIENLKEKTRGNNNINSLEQSENNSAGYWPHASIPCIVADCESRVFDAPSKSGNGLFNYYLMDPASLLPLELLALDPLVSDTESSYSLLDMCSAPGGKALAMLQHFSKRASITNAKAGPKQATVSFTLNEPNFERRRRLRRVMDDYLPSSFLNRTANITVDIAGNDATDARVYAPESFDRILLDAPCSSDRHHIQDGTGLPTSTSNNLSKIQQALLVNALSWLKPGGRMVYATCSLCPRENDQVIEKAISAVKKKKSACPVNIKISRPACSFDGAEKTKWGWIVLPDKGRGFGPLYFCVLSKEK